MTINLGTVIQLVRTGIATGTAIYDAIRGHRVTVTHDDTGDMLTAEEVADHITAAQAQALATGDHAASRIEDRHGDETLPPMPSPQGDGDDGA